MKVCIEAGRLRFFAPKHVKTHLVERVNKGDFFVRKTAYMYLRVFPLFFFIFSRGKRGNKKFATMSRNC